jgi:hypothetical protein
VCLGVFQEGGAGPCVCVSTDRVSPSCDWEAGGLASAAGATTWKRGGQEGGAGACVGFWKEGLVDARGTVTPTSNAACMAAPRAYCPAAMLPNAPHQQAIAHELNLANMGNISERPCAAHLLPPRVLVIIIS